MKQLKDMQDAFDYTCLLSSIYLYIHTYIRRALQKTRRVCVCMYICAHTHTHAHTQGVPSHRGQLREAHAQRDCPGARGAAAHGPRTGPSKALSLSLPALVCSMSIDAAKNGIYHDLFAGLETWSDLREGRIVGSSVVERGAPERSTTQPTPMARPPPPGYHEAVRMPGRAYEGYVPPSVRPPRPACAPCRRVGAQQPGPRERGPR